MIGLNFFNKHTNKYFIPIIVSVCIIKTEKIVLRAGVTFKIIKSAVIILLIASLLKKYINKCQTAVLLFTIK